MKKTFAFLLAVLLAGPIAAQDAPASHENLQNTDFSDGTNHWHGDIKPAGADLTTDFNSTATGTGGITVDLRSANWTKVTQQIEHYRGTGHGLLVLTVVYQTSSDFKLSTFNTDYGPLGPQIGFDGARIPTSVGNIVAVIDGADSQPWSTPTGVNTYTIHYDNVGSACFTPSTDASPQTFTSPINFTFANKPTFCLAIPPGSGSITILKISLTAAPRQTGFPGGFPGHP